VVLETLVLSLSSLEHEGINYLHLNADKYGLTAEKLDKMRVSSINASPVTEAIEDCLESITTQVDTPRGVADAMEGVESTSNGEAQLYYGRCDAKAGAYRASLGFRRKSALAGNDHPCCRHQTAFRPYADKCTIDQETHP